MCKQILFLLLFLVNLSNGFAQPVLKVIGLMSGTSMDGIDVCLIETDGDTINSVAKGHTYPFPQDFRVTLRQRVLSDHPNKADDDRQLEHQLTELHSQAVKDYIAAHHLAHVDLIGFHGQTLDHRPDEHLTYQIGDGQLLADLTGIDVINDFRSNDMAHDGQGAPLAPVYHKALAHGLEKPIAIVNIGGVTNLTYIDDQDLIAFDTGPGNALLDDWVFAHTGEPFDKDGQLAAQGIVHTQITDDVLDNRYFSLTPPKSLDRNSFKDVKAKIDTLSLEDGAATLLYLTTASLAMAQHHLPKQVKHWYICGGGRHNKTLMKILQQHLKGPVSPIEDIGNDGDYTEAQLIGFLAARSLYNLPLSFPGTTGVDAPVSGGNLYLPSRG